MAMTTEAAERRRAKRERRVVIAKLAAQQAKRKKISAAQRLRWAEKREKLNFDDETVKDTTIENAGSPDIDNLLDLPDI